MTNIHKKKSIKFTNFAQMKFSPSQFHTNKINLNIFMYIDQCSPLIQNYSCPNIRKDILQSLLNNQKNSLLQSKNIPISKFLERLPKKEQQKLIEESVQELKRFRDQTNNQTFQAISHIYHLTQKIFLIGNQNHIDVFQSNKNLIEGQNGVFLFTQFYWSLNSQQGPINSLAITKQIKNQDRFIALAHPRKVVIYFLQSKFIIQQPKKIFQLSFPKQILKIDFIKKRFLLVYFIDSFQILEITEASGKLEAILFLQQNYGIDPSQKQQIFDISKVADNSIKIFFTSNSSFEDESTFRLSFIQIVFNDAYIFKVMPMKKIYDIKIGLKQLLKIHNYSKEIILMSLGHEIIAFKNGLAIDNANVNIRDNLYFLDYFYQKDALTHIQNDRIQEYDFFMSTQFNPEKILINPKDSIAYKTPQNTKIFKITDTQYGYNIFLRETNHKISSSNQNKGILNYWFCMSFEVNTLQKLQQIFVNSQTIQNFSESQLTIACDTATKLGLSQKQAYFECWKRSYKNTQKSYSILLMTNDVDLILSQMESMSQKTLKYRDIVKIIKECIYFLKDTIMSLECTQNSVINFLKCNFLMLKLETFKDFQLFRKKIEAEAQLQKLNFGMKIISGNFKEIISMNKTYLPKQEPKIPEKQNFSSQIGINQGHSYKSKIKESQNLNTNNPDEKGLVLGIKAYKFYNQANVKSIFLSQLSEFTYNPAHENPIIVIRYFIKNFRILYRIVYEELMTKALKQQKFQILEILHSFPEFLPVEGLKTNNQEFQTIWMPFSKKDFTFHVFLPQLETIDNQQIIKSIAQNLWIKRNIFTFHGLINESSNKVLQICNCVRSRNRVFYLFYQELFRQRDLLKKAGIRISEAKSTKDKQTGLKKQEIQEKQKKIIKILNQVANTYPLIPENLKNFYEIYYALYFDIGQQDPEIQRHQLIDFIQLTSYQLFKLYFQKEKSVKGYILGRMYSLYEDKLNDGKQIFIKGLEDYFKEEQQTSISDLKVILNRFNSKKSDFQMENQNLFVVLVDCLTKVVLISRDSKLNLEQQLLVYVRNVSFNKSNTALILKLRYLNRINIELKLLQQVDINMTIHQIQHNGEQTLFRIVSYMIQKWQIKKITLKNTQYDYFKSFSYLICSHANSFRAHIYFSQHLKFLLFLYVTEILKEEHLVSWIFQFLDDPYIKNFFNVDRSFKQSVFFYMLNWRLSVEHAIYKFHHHNPQQKSLEQIKTENSIFLSHKLFIQQILQFIDQNTLDRKFVQLEIQYTERIEELGCKLTYPISNNYTTPTLSQFQNHIQRCSGIKKINSDFLRGIFDILDKMREICEPNVKENLEKKKRWFIMELYNIALYNLIERNLLLQSVKIVEKMFQIQQYHESAILYPILIMQPILEIIPEKNRISIIELISYYFYKPKELLDIVKSIFSEKRTTDELQKYLHDRIKCTKQFQSCKMYTSNNFLFKKDIFQKLNHIDEQHSERQIVFEKVLYATLNHLLSSKQDFRKNKIYHILFKIMCHSPYLAAKFIALQTKPFNIKNFRAFISYMALQVIFDSQNVLKMGICIHEMLLYRVTNNTTMLEIIKSYQDSSLPKPKGFHVSHNHSLREVDLFLIKSLKIMNEKLKFYQQNNLSQKIKQGYLKINKNYKIKEMLSKAKLQRRLAVGKRKIRRISGFFSEKDNYSYQMKSVIEYALLGLDPFQLEQRRKMELKIMQRKNKGSEMNHNSGTINIEEFEDSQKYDKISFQNVQYIFDNPEIIKELIPSIYFFKNGQDQDDSYSMTKQDEIIWSGNITFPVNIPFDQRSKRHEILETESSKRFDNSKTNKQRKLSQYFLHSFNGKSKPKGFSEINEVENQFSQTTSIFMTNNRFHEQQSPQKEASVFGSSLGLKSKQSNDSGSIFHSFLGVRINESPQMRRESSNQGPSQNAKSLRGQNIFSTQVGNLAPNSLRKIRKRESLRSDLSSMLEESKSPKFQSQQNVFHTNDSFLLRNLKIVCIQIQSNSLIKVEDIKQKIYTCLNPNNLNISLMTDLKNTLKDLYQNEFLSAVARLKLLEVILSEVKLDDYVPEYMKFYIQATGVPFVNELMRKFSVIFKFEGLFYSRKVHEERLKKRNSLYSILQQNDLKQESINSEPTEECLILNTQKFNSKNECFSRQSEWSLKEILFFFLIQDLRMSLNMANITQIAMIVEKCLQNNVYFKKLYFELMVSTAEGLVDKINQQAAKGKGSNRQESQDDEEAEEQNMIKLLIQQLDDEVFMSEALGKLPGIRSVQKQIISQILSECVKEKTL